MTAALPVSVAPRPGDSIESWLEHLADANGLTTAQLLAATDRGRAGNRYLTLAPSPETITRLAALARIDEGSVYAILGADDLDVAATLLTPWTELTPRTNDGPLGWLADRTVMTPALTRLVMAARAPHRRLSHHLDTPRTDGVRMPINLLVVPQVIPHEQYVEHVAGAFESSEATVRLFASLSLARLHPDVRSWASAAEALGMPGPMGVRCARACSPTMLITADEWKARVWRAGEQTPQENYRALEAKFRLRLGMSRWFEEWARRNRPGTRHGDYDRGLTWQWVHVAHAHLDLSPAWRGRKPAATDRARYRQFEASLDDKQGRELAYAVQKRA